MCEINDGEVLYRFAHPDAFPSDQKEIPLSIFNDTNLSCDWAKYQKEPENSFHVLSLNRSIIISIEVCDEIRNPRNPKREGELVESWKQKIFHDPITEVDESIHGANNAHSLIQGKKKKAVQETIRDHSMLKTIK